MLWGLIGVCVSGFYKCPWEFKVYKALQLIGIRVCRLGPAIPIFGFRVRTSIDLSRPGVKGMCSFAILYLR